MAKPALSFAIEPYQIRHYTDGASRSALHGRHTAYLSGLGAPFRLISRVFPAELGAIRQPLVRRADDLVDLADLLQRLDRVLAGQVDLAEAVALARHYDTALRRAFAEHPERKACVAALDDLVRGRISLDALRALRASAEPLLWRWRWLVNHQRMLDTIAEEFPPLAIAHHLLVWDEDQHDAELFQASLREALLLPAVEQAPLPPLIQGRYRETATMLEPLSPGGDYLTVLTAYDLPGQSWGYINLWSELLMGELPLALALDVTTLPRAGVRDKVADVITMLEATLTSPSAPNDQRTKDAYHSAVYVQEHLGQQQLHQLHYAILLGAPTPRALRERVRAVQNRLSGWMRLEQVPGAQGAYVKLFSPLPVHTIAAPLVRQPTLSEGLAVKLPLGWRKGRATGGIFWGYDGHEGMPLYHDMWGAEGVENAHLMMIGKSGSGKTVALQALALRHALDGTQVVFFDPLGKSKYLCEAVGRPARYSPVDTTAAINILDPAAPDLKRQRDVVARRLSALLGRVLIQGEEVSYIPRPLDNFALGALDRALQDPELYGAEGRYLPTLNARSAPLLGNLVNALRRHGERSGIRSEAAAALLLADEIESRLLGSSSHLFNAPTELSWEFDRDVVGFNFKGADRELLPLYYESGFEALNAWVRSDRRKARYRHLLAILDEYRIMASYRELEQYVAFATKAWRNHGAAMWTADQNAVTYFRDGSEWAAFTAENVALTIIGRQEGMGAELLERIYRDRIAPDLLQKVRTFAAGELLLLVGNRVHQIAMQLTDLEQHYFLRLERQEEEGRRAYA